MRYLVTARVKAGRELALLKAIDDLSKMFSDKDALASSRSSVLLAANVLADIRHARARAALVQHLFVLDHADESQCKN